MRFNIFVGNHNAASGDLTLHLQTSLACSGHEAAVSTRLEPGCCNILIENFGPKLVELAIDLAFSGTPIILWGTEEITGETFNTGVADDHGHYGDREVWKLRYDNFLTVAEHATAVWVPTENLVPSYGAAVPGVPVQLFPHGYAEGYPALAHRPEADKDIDFHFSGSVTAHRTSLLAQLAQRHKVVRHHHEIPEAQRRDYLARAKVCLSLRLGPQTRMPSVTRMHALIMNRCFTLHERCPLASHLDACVTHVEPDALPEACEAALRSTQRRAQADAMLDRLRETLPMKRIVPRLLDEAFGSRR